MAKLDNKQHLKNGKITSLIQASKFPIDPRRPKKFDVQEVRPYTPSKTRKKKK